MICIHQRLRDVLSSVYSKSAFFHQLYSSFCTCCQLLHREQFSLRSLITVGFCAAADDRTPRLPSRTASFIFSAFQPARQEKWAADRVYQRPVKDSSGSAAALIQQNVICVAFPGTQHIFLRPDGKRLDHRTADFAFQFILYMPRLPARAAAPTSMTPSSTRPTMVSIVSLTKTPTAGISFFNMLCSCSDLLGGNLPPAPCKDETCKIQLRRR